MPLILPLLWKFGKRLMLHRLPCSIVILFVCIICNLNVNSFPPFQSPFGSAVRVYLRISRAYFKGAKDKVFKMILPRISKISKKPCQTLAVLPYAKLRAINPTKRFPE